MVMLRNFSLEDFTVLIPEIALTTVDLPWATCPIVPMLIVAYQEITSGDKGVKASILSLSRVTHARFGLRSMTFYYSSIEGGLKSVASINNINY